MINLITFDPFLPSPGLAFWGLLIFLLFWFIMGKLAFKPIAEALKKREDHIQDALDTAKNTKLEMANLKAENEKLLASAREERAKIIRSAKETANSVVEESKTKAKTEASKIVNSAKIEIENQKKSAMAEVKNEVGALALSIAEKVIKKELATNSDQQSFVNKLVDEINLN